MKQVFQTHGAEIEVLDEVKLRTPQEELVEDLIAIISHFSGKLYGLRSHKYKEVVENAKDLFTQP